MRAMKLRAQVESHEAAARQCGNFYQSPQRIGRGTILAALAAIAAVVGLSSCSGYTTAANSGGGTQGDPPAGVLSAGSPSVSFGSMAVGTTGTQSVTLTNTGTAAVNISQAVITGAAFTIVGNPSTSVGIGQSATYQMQFAPTAEGAATGSLAVTSDASDSPVTVPLTGTGLQAEISANPSGVAFTSVIVGNSDTQPITLRNTGNATLTFSAVNTTGSGFSSSGVTTSTTIAAGGTATLDAIFTPATATSTTGAITLTTNGAPSSLTINLSGTGVAATRLISANPTSLSFGTVALNSSSQMSTTLTNNGNSNVTVSGVTVTGAGFSASGVSNGTTLALGQSAILVVTFAPTTAGAVTGASVSVASNATGSPMTMGLSGTGQAVTTYSVLLNWTASVTPGVSGYNVFRGTTLGDYGSTPLNPSPISGTTYTDSSVATGQQYFYVVTAINDGVSSADSMDASAMIP